MVNLMDPFLTSMCALAVLKNGLLRMSDTFESGCISSTTKSTSTKKEYFRRCPMDIRLIDRPAEGILMLAQVQCD